MDEMVKAVAEVLMYGCPTDPSHSRQMAGQVVESLSLHREERDGRCRYVTDWFDE